MHRSIILSAGIDTASSTCDCGHPAYMHAPLGCWSTRGDCDALCTCAGYRDTGRSPAVDADTLGGGALGGAA